MSAAILKLAVPAVLAALVFLGGGMAKADTKKAYEAGYKLGKSDALAGEPEDLNPSGAIKGASADDVAAYNLGYSDGFKANKKVAPAPVPGGGGSGGKVNKFDQETAAQAMSRGFASGLADGRQDGSAGNGYGYTHTKSPYTSMTLKNAFESQWNSGYAKGYSEGVKIKEDGGGIVMGDVLGTRGYDPRSFMPHTVATGGWGRESLRRPGGYPRDWYNY